MSSFSLVWRVRSTPKSVTTPHLFALCSSPSTDPPPLNSLFTHPYIWPVAYCLFIGIQPAPYRCFTLVTHNSHVLLNHDKTVNSVLELSGSYAYPGFHRMRGVDITAPTLRDTCPLQSYFPPRPQVHTQKSMSHFVYLVNHDWLSTLIPFQLYSWSEMMSSQKPYLMKSKMPL